jgi:AbrB family looped-hinge helix DNA binding protein
MTTATVSTKGWVVIPKALREKYDLTPGKKVQVVDYAGKIWIVPTSENPIKAMYGMLKGSRLTTDLFLKEKREELEREEAKIERLIRAG